MITMSGSLLDFRTLLKALATIFGTNEFDSRTAAKAVAKHLYSKKKILKSSGERHPS
jgi:hypothetical protein